MVVETKARFAALGLGFACAILTAVTGHAHQTQFANDVIAFLDSCQRLALGQVAHQDFQSPLGAGAFIPFVAVMRVTGINARALPWGAAFCIAGFTVWAWIIARPRFSPWSAALLAVFTGLLSGTAYTLDFGGWQRPSYGMIYNRVAWAAFVVLATECCLPPRQPDHRSERIGAISTGAALGLLTLIKVNFAAVSTTVALIGLLVTRRWTLVRLTCLAGAAAATAVAIYAVAPFSVSGYLHEWIGLARVEQSFGFRAVVTRVLHDNLLPLALAFVVLLLLVTRPALRAQRLSITLVAALLIGAGLTVSIANCQFAELPVFPLAALVVFEATRRAVAGHVALPWEWLAMTPVVFFLLPHLALPLREAAWQRAKRPLLAPQAQIMGPPVARLAMTPWPGEPLEPAAAAQRWGGGEGSPYAFAQWVNDGLALLRPHISPQSRVLAMDWSNPFPIALGLPPPRGDHTAWHWGRTVGERHHVAPETLLANADFVMVPAFGGQPDTIAAKLRVYGPLLREQFTPIAQSEIWTLWRRRGAPAPDQVAGR